MQKKTNKEAQKDNRLEIHGEDKALGKKMNKENLKETKGEIYEEAKAILDTGLLMGLILEKDEESALKIIKNNLKI